MRWVLRLNPTYKETGFLPNLWVATKYFRKKPGFWTTIMADYQLPITDYQLPITYYPFPLKLC